MINKTYKLINNKFPRFFRFVFSIRYLFVIFFISITVFLTIPKLFDYKKKEDIIKIFLQKNYGLKVNKFDKITYQPFPRPNLKITNLKSDFYSSSNKIKTKKLIIFPKFISIYNYENFQSSKIILNDNEILSDFKGINLLSKNILRLKKKINFNNLNIQIKDKNKNIIYLKEINFSNNGYKKNSIEGKVFNKKFKVSLADDLKKIDFKLLNTGISASLNIFESTNTFKLIGILKGKILKSNFKLDFLYNENVLKVKKFYFRDKDLAFDSTGLIDLKPYFKILLDTEIKNLNVILLNDLDLSKILSYKNFLKTINSQYNINFKPKRFSSNLFDEIKIKTNLAYGRLNISKKVILAKSMFKCDGNINLIAEYPVLDFKCIIISNDKKELLKKFKLNYKIKNEALKLKINGNLNLLSNKINFDLIEMNESYKASIEDLKYFKNSFEEILFNESFIKIFNDKKIKKFIVEIS